MEYSRHNAIHIFKLGYKRQSNICLALLLWVNCHEMSILKQPCGEIHMERHWDLLPTASRKLRPQTTPLQ